MVKAEFSGEEPLPVSGRRLFEILDQLDVVIPPQYLSTPSSVDEAYLRRLRQEKPELFYSVMNDLVNQKLVSLTGIGLGFMVAELRECFPGMEVRSLDTGTQKPEIGETETAAIYEHEAPEMDVNQRELCLDLFTDTVIGDRVEAFEVYGVDELKRAKALATRQYFDSFRMAMGWVRNYLNQAIVSSRRQKSRGSASAQLVLSDLLIPDPYSRTKTVTPSFTFWQSLVFVCREKGIRIRDYAKLETVFNRLVVDIQQASDIPDLEERKVMLEKATKSFLLILKEDIDDITNRFPNDKGRKRVLTKALESHRHLTNGYFAKAMGMVRKRTGDN